MELPGGLATFARITSRSANLPCSSGLNAEHILFLIVGQAMIGGRGVLRRPRPESGRDSAVSWILAKNP